ncbi:hypothetical protein [Salinisphaera hydrothermalis]|uniref:Uncharacterized protein n=1 Tax=Salinisphaera hydrothermalis (strain C41B8) TaxID=1304275 RepID=A0A084INM7_SALHC|nr:hypothetical protein [Salinisphaera hydrothermalis]KEZ78311.1 hypothetical protein C41B8_05398 [Salinisphaera hydrothermalis C41B8]
MRADKQVLSAAEPGQWFIPNHWPTPFQVAVGVSVTGTATYDVEYTYVDVRRETPAAGDIYSKAADQTAAGEALFDMPVAAIRVNVTAYTDGEVIGHFLQSGG